MDLIALSLAGAFMVVSLVGGHPKIFTSFFIHFICHIFKNYLPDCWSFLSSIFSFPKIASIPEGLNFSNCLPSSSLYIEKSWILNARLPVRERGISEHFEVLPFKGHDKVPFFGIFGGSIA